MNNQEKDATLTGTFKILDNLNQMLNEKVIANGYGMRGKSRWVREAIESLFTYSDCAELVSISSEMENANYPLSVRLPRKLFLDMEKAVIVIRKKFPELEGIKSRIVRTAILQRLIRDP